MKKLLFFLAILAILFTACPKPDDPDGPTPTPAPGQTPEPGVEILNLDFDSETGPISLEKGTAGESNEDLVNIDGHDCLTIDGTTVDQYGSIGVEIQFTLPEATDFSGEDYTISFDYYIDAASDAVDYIQFQFRDTADSYNGLYSNGMAGADAHVAGSWRIFSMPIEAASVEYSNYASPAEWDSFDVVRIQAKTSTENDNLLIYIDNLIISTP